MLIQHKIVLICNKGTSSNLISGYHATPKGNVHESIFFSDVDLLLEIFYGRCWWDGVSKFKASTMS